jgi:general secretion pathway protein G
MNYLSSSKGMTLIEIMVVIVIVGMLTTVITISANSTLDKSKVETTKIQLLATHQALEMYKVIYGSFPSTEAGLNELVKRGIIKEIPKDSYGNELQYIREDSKTYTLRSISIE